MAQEAADDRMKSLQELEYADWGEPNYDSYLVTTCHRLRRKPLMEFTIEDLSTMIGQQIGLPYLLPLALDRLAEDPLVGGDMFPGDLLTVVAGVPPQFWQQHPDLQAWMNVFMFKLQQTLETAAGAVAQYKRLNPEKDSQPDG